MKTYEQINNRIESGKAVVLTADEIIDYGLHVDTILFIRILNPITH